MTADSDSFAGTLAPTGSILGRRTRKRTKMASSKQFPLAASVSSDTDSSSVGGRKTTSSGVPVHHKVAKLVPFLRKVQQLCEGAPRHIARWSADGKQFDVLDPKGFDDLLKVHFEGAAPATFHRQLFFYGWVKLNHANGGGDEKTKGTWSFRHPLFLRDEPSKIYEIKRYARAADREELEDASRVDILERRVSALQSLVDDLSRKLAAVQLTLDRTPLALEKPVRKRVKDVDEYDMYPISAQQQEDDVDDFMAEPMRLSEDEIMQLFEDCDPLSLDEEVRMEQETQSRQEQMMKMTPPASVSKGTEPASAPGPMKHKLSSKEEEEMHAKEFLSSIMSTPQFQAAITSKTMQEAKPSASKVEALPHLSVC